MQISTAYTAEIELRVTATYLPEEPETPPSYASGGEPGCAAGVEDVTIEGLSFERVEQGPWEAWQREGRGGFGKSRIVHVDLCEGVDLKSPDVQRLLANLVEALGSDLEGDLLAQEERGRP